MLIVSFMKSVSGGQTMNYSKGLWEIDVLVQEIILEYFPKVCWKSRWSLKLLKCSVGSSWGFLISAEQTNGALPWDFIAIVAWLTIALEQWLIHCFNKE